MNFEQFVMRAVKEEAPLFLCFSQKIRNRRQKFQPTDESIYQNRSEIYKQTKQYGRAITDYTRLIEINPRSTWGLSRSEVYRIPGKLQKAEADTKAADEIIKKRGY